MINLYGLKHCTTCQKAIKYLKQHNITVEEIDIREHPPAAELIEAALINTGGKPRQIMNTSGELYRELGLKDKLNDMSQAELVTLLTENGMLLKRPFITDGEKTSSGAKPEVLTETWINRLNSARKITERRRNIMAKVYTENGLCLAETADKTIKIGISAYGQDEIGEVAYFSFIGAGDAITAGEPFFSVESSKAVTDAIAPISGEIVRKNESLENNPDDLNAPDDAKNWIVEIKPSEAFDPTKFLAEDLPID